MLGRGGLEPHSHSPGGTPGNHKKELQQSYLRKYMRNKPLNVLAYSYVKSSEDQFEVCLMMMKMKLY